MAYVDILNEKRAKLARKGNDILERDEDLKLEVEAAEAIKTVILVGSEFTAVSKASDEASKFLRQVLTSGAELLGEATKHDIGAAQELLPIMRGGLVNYRDAFAKRVAFLDALIEQVPVQGDPAEQPTQPGSTMTFGQMLQGAMNSVLVAEEDDEASQVATPAETAPTVADAPQIQVQVFEVTNDPYERGKPGKLFIPSNEMPDLSDQIRRSNMMQWRPGCDCVRCVALRGGLAA